MNPRRKVRLWLACSVLGGLALTVGLVMYALSANIDLFYTPGKSFTASGKMARSRNRDSACALAAW